MADDQYKTYAEVKERLDQIVEAVSDDSLPLDDALDLYEEAVSLGLRASDLLEADIKLEAQAASGDADEDAADEAAQEQGAPADADAR